MEFRVGSHAIRVNLPDRDALSAAVAARLDAGEGFSLATINLDHLVKLRDDPSFADTYSAQDFVVADGNPVVALSRLAGTPVRLVPGSDLVVPLARLAALKGTPVALFGSTALVLDAAAEALVAEAPGVSVVCRIAPPMGFDPDGAAAAEMLEEIARSGARLCFVALGAPRQERFSARGRGLAPAVGFVSVGAGLDFLAGAQRRAPAWMRGLALEWLWRLASDPRRLAPRYARCAAILPGEAVRAVRSRNG